MVRKGRRWAQRGDLFSQMHYSWTVRRYDMIQYVAARPYPLNMPNLRRYRASNTSFLICWKLVHEFSSNLPWKDSFFRATDRIAPSSRWYPCFIEIKLPSPSIISYLWSFERVPCVPFNAMILFISCQWNPIPQRVIYIYIYRVRLDRDELIKISAKECSFFFSFFYFFHGFCVY